MSWWEKTKLVAPLVVFNILLPTWDVFSDVKLSVKLILGDHQSCFREEKNIREFRQELELCLVNPQEYCERKSNVSYLCQNINSSCIKCNALSFLSSDSPATDCKNSEAGIKEIYKQYLKNENLNKTANEYCSDPNTYKGICKDGTQRHYKFALLLLGIYFEVSCKSLGNNILTLQ